MNVVQKSATIGLCASLVLHGLTMFALLLWVIRDLDRQIGFPPFPTQPQREARAPFDRPDKEELGDELGLGRASNSSSGESLAQTPIRFMNQQAGLSLDAEGIGDIPPEPSPSPTPLNGGAAGRLLEESRPTAVASATPFGPGAGAGGAGEGPPVPHIRILVPGPQVEPVIGPGSNPLSSTASTQPILVAVTPGTGGGGAGGAGGAGGGGAASPNEPSGQNGSGGNPIPAADPMPKADAESVPTSDEISARLINGQLDARFGRKIKPAFVHLTLAGEIERETMPDPIVSAKLKLDAEGKVVDVELVKPSGKPAIDQPVYDAMWKVWIEPPKNALGQAMADTCFMHIHLR